MKPTMKTQLIGTATSKTNKNPFTFLTWIFSKDFIKWDKKTIERERAQWIQFRKIIPTGTANAVDVK